MQKKYIWLMIGIGILVAVAMGICFPKIDFVLNGESEIKVNYQEEYQDAGARLRIFGIPQDSKVTMTSTVDSSTLGIYEVTYEMKWLHITKTLSRTVEVTDLEAPKILPSFDAVVSIVQEEKSGFPVFTATDNYDGDVTASIVVDSFDSNHIGTHFVKVTAQDSHGNIGTYIQAVAVYPEDVENVGIFPLELKDGIYHLNVMENQVCVDGYVKQRTEQGKLQLVGKKVMNVEMIDLSNDEQVGYFQSMINVDELPNDSYQIYYVDDQVKQPLTEQAILTAQRLGRWHIGNKLVTFSYQDGLFITVEDFEYQYDLAIDVGHGGNDVGAVGLGVYERDINLMVSLYEKQRFEEHGLKVWLIREQKDYPELLGDEDWVTLQKVSYTLGWYGAVSKFTYSNHHNSDTVGTTRGPEIIVLPDLTKEALAVEYRLCEEWKQLYPKINTKWPIFTRNYDNGRRFTKVGGEVYPMRVFYANMRYPWECFGVVTTTYEGAYINNSADYKWYVDQEGWKKVSEMKIKAYVEALGKEYQAPKM